MHSFLKNLEEVLKTYLKETYLPPHRAKTPGWNFHDLRFFSKGAEMLSTAFTEGRSELPKNYFNKKEFRSAYLLYFVLINAAKIWKCLEEVSFLLKKSPLKILDLGCGPGTAALTCSYFFKDRPLEILGLEQNPGIAKDAKNLWEKVRSPEQRLFIKTESFHPRHKSLKKLLDGKKFDVAIAANILSELSFQDQRHLITELLDNSKMLIVVEPALQKITRDLMSLRDKVVQDKQAQVIAPCLHQQNCPMLAFNQRDWCHFYIDWKCPVLIRQVDDIIRNRHDYLKMAYMIFRSPLFTIHCPQSSSNTWRVVSSPLISKGKRELVLCGDCGHLKKIDRLDKDKTPQNSGFDYMSRGDIMEWSGTSRVERENHIKVLKKF